MPLPTWLARFNRRYINPTAVRRGKWPVLIHVGRTSGTTYHTPLGVYPTADGYLFTVNYTESDWPKNVMAAGSATLLIDGESVGLTDPELVPVEEAYRLARPDAKVPPNWVGVSECLVVKTDGATPSASETEPRFHSKP